MIRIVLPVTPVAAPRQTQKDKWMTRPETAAYHLYRDQVRLHWRETNFQFPDSGASIIFHLPMPKSWPEKKKREMEGKPHQQKPDKDNLEKGFLDALFYPNTKSKIKLPLHDQDDSRIYHTREVAKYWSREQHTSIEVFLPEYGRHITKRQLSQRSKRKARQEDGYDAAYAAFV